MADPDFKKMVEELRELAEAVDTPDPPQFQEAPAEAAKAEPQVQFVDDQMFASESGGSMPEKIVEQLELIRIRLQNLPREIVEELRNG